MVPVRPTSRPPRICQSRSAGLLSAPWLTAWRRDCWMTQTILKDGFGLRRRTVYWATLMLLRTLPTKRETWQKAFRKPILRVPLSRPDWIRSKNRFGPRGHRYKSTFSSPKTKPLQFLPLLSNATAPFHRFGTALRLAVDSASRTASTDSNSDKMIPSGASGP